MKAEETRLLDELEALQKEEEETLKAIEEQEVVAQKISKEEERYWKEYIRHKRDFIALEDEGRRYKLSLFKLCLILKYSLCTSNVKRLILNHLNF